MMLAPQLTNNRDGGEQYCWFRVWPSMHHSANMVEEKEDLKEKQPSTNN